MKVKDAARPDDVAQSEGVAGGNTEELRVKETSAGGMEGFVGAQVVVTPDKLLPSACHNTTLDSRQ